MAATFSGPVLWEIPYLFCLQCGRDLSRRFVGDNGDALVGSQPETDADGVARAGGQFGVNCVGEKSIRHKVFKIARERA